MPAVIYITATAVISDYQVFKNEISVFKSMETVMPGFLMAVYHHLDSKYPKFYKMDNLSKLGWLAAEVLLKDNFDAGKYKAEEIGIVFTNAGSSLDADLKYFESTKDIASPALFVYTLPNIVMGEICIKHKFKGENAFFIFETFDAGFIEKYVRNLFDNNILQACICGWVELIDNEGLAVLFLVEKTIAPETETNRVDQTNKMLFTKDNLNKIYQLKNG